MEGNVQPAPAPMTQEQAEKIAERVNSSGYLLHHTAWAHESERGGWQVSIAPVGKDGPYYRIYQPEDWTRFVNDTLPMSTAGVW